MQAVYRYLIEKEGPTLMSADLRDDVRQVLAVQALELRKRFLGKRAIPVYLLALIPLFLFTARFVALQVFHCSRTASIAHDRVVYAGAVPHVDPALRRLLRLRGRLRTRCSAATSSTGRCTTTSSFP